MDLTVRGVVLDEFGAPAAGLKVLLYPAPKKGAKTSPIGPCDAFGSTFARDLPGTTGWPRCESGKDGRFELVASKAETCILVAGPPEYLEAWKVAVPKPRGTGEEHVLTVEKGLAVRGRVLDAEGKAGIEGMVVWGSQTLQGNWGYGWIQARRRTAVSARDGSFVLEGFSAGSLRVILRPQKGSFLEPHENNRKDAEAGDTDLVLKVRTAGEVEFSAVEAESGEPLEVPILAKPPRKFRWADFIECSRVGPGRYVLRSVGGKGMYRLAPRDYIARLVEIEVRSGSRTVLAEPMEFALGSTIVGTVAFPDAAEKHFAFVYYRLRESAGHPYQHSESSSKGAYRVGGLIPGRYDVVALARGFRASRTVCEVGIGETKLDFRLEARRLDDPPTAAELPFKENKKMMIAFGARDLPMAEAVDWMRELTGVDLKIRPGLDLTDRIYDLTLKVGEPCGLDYFLKLALVLKGLRVDEKTGEIYK
ncbi:MAG: carboxypeptidase-like regulatory domain-containing protein [Planctomycetota bacterium]